MKFKNLAVGMVVKVKKSNDFFDNRYSGNYGKVVQLYGNTSIELDVLVDFGKYTDWGFSKDLKYKDDNGNLFTNDVLGD